MRKYIIKVVKYEKVGLKLRKGGKRSESMLKRKVYMNSDACCCQKEQNETIKYYTVYSRLK